MEKSLESPFLRAWENNQRTSVKGKKSDRIGYGDSVPIVLQHLIATYSIRLKCTILQNFTYE